MRIPKRLCVIFINVLMYYRGVIAEHSSSLSCLLYVFYSEDYLPQLGKIKSVGKGEI